MGRKKPAPQPLSLPDSNSATATSPTPSLTRDTSPASSAVGRGPGNLTATSSTLSTADSQSPNSATIPRPSPFSSKFAPKRPQTARAAQASHKAADSLSLPKRRPSPTLVDGQPQHSAAYTRTTAQPDTTAATSPSETRKSKGSLFHFTKPSKPANQFAAHAAHEDPGPARAQTMPLAIPDDPQTSGQGGTLAPNYTKTAVVKQAGRRCFPLETPGPPFAPIVGQAWLLWLAGLTEPTHAPAPPHQKKMALVASPMLLTRHHLGSGRLSHRHIQ